jgi:hypothetical protein
MRISQLCRPRFLFVCTVLLFLLLVWVHSYQDQLHLHIGGETSIGNERQTTKTTLYSMQASVDAAICGQPQATFFNGSNWRHLVHWRSPSESFFSFQMRIISRGLDEQLILAEWDTVRPQRGDFLSVSIKGGRLLFAFDPGRGLTEVIHPDLIPFNVWCRVKAWRTQKVAGLTVNGRSLTTQIQGSSVSVNSNSGLYVGGVPVNSTGTPYVIPKSGFLGCISNFQLNNKSLELT